jgi:AcrR family transcriptional regulator
LTKYICNIIFDQTFSQKLLVVTVIFLINVLTERLTKILPMSPRTEQQFIEIRETRKKEIMDTALELFAAEGFDKTSISSITSKAGISKGLLYNYFDSKEDLIKTIIFNGLDRLTGYIDPNKDGVLSRDELQYFIEEFFNAVVKNEHYWRLYFTLFFQPHVLKLVEKRMIVMIHTYMKMLVNYFRSIGSDDPETDAIMLGAVLDGIGFHFMANTATFPVEKIKRKLIKMYC